MAMKRLGVLLRLFKQTVACVAFQKKIPLKNLAKVGN